MNESTDPVTYRCDLCDYSTTHKSNFTKHMTSTRHKRNDGEIIPNKTYDCSYCNYVTNQKSHYSDHIASKAHEYKKNVAEKGIKPNQCICCLREFNSKTSLWRHKNHCKPEDHPVNIAINESENNKTTANDAVIDVLVKQNDELRNMFVSQQNLVLTQTQQMATIVNTLVTNGISSNTNNSHNNNHTNSHNQTFNINYFLNEKCKNAVDIHDFIQNLDYSQESLKKNAHLSYPERITKQIRDGLGNYNVEDRPIHCSDAKRQKIYIKHNGEWVTEYKFNDVVSKIGENNTGTFRQWAIENPNFRHLDTPEYEQYMKIYPGNIGPTSDQQEEKYTKKILGGFIDEILIDKEKYAI
jgi:hypothetical protein